MVPRSRLLLLLLVAAAAESQSVVASRLRHFTLSAEGLADGREAAGLAHAPEPDRHASAAHLLEIAAEAVPSVVLPGSHSEAADLRGAWRRLWLLGGLLLAALTPVLRRQGLAPFLMALLYVTSLTMVKFTVKVSIQAGLVFPYSITVSHMLLTAAVAIAIDPPRCSEAVRVLPVAVANGLAVALDNGALVFGGIAFVAMIGCCTPASTCALEVLAGRRSVASLGTLAVVIVCTGGMLCVRGEHHYSGAALLLASLAILFRSSKCLWQHELLMSLPLFHVIAWSSIWGLCTVLPVALKFEGLGFVRHLWLAEPKVQGLAALSACTAALLNVMHSCSLREMGPLVQTVTGNLQLIMVVALASVWLRETVSPLQWAGVLMLAAGASLVKSTPATGKESRPPGPAAWEARVHSWTARLGLGAPAESPLPLNQAQVPQMSPSGREPLDAVCAGGAPGPLT